MFGFERWHTPQQDEAKRKETAGACEGCGAED